MDRRRFFKLLGLGAAAPVIAKAFPALEAKPPVPQTPVPRSNDCAWQWHVFGFKIRGSYYRVKLWYRHKYSPTVVPAGLRTYKPVLDAEEIYDLTRDRWVKDRYGNGAEYSSSVYERYNRIPIIEQEEFLNEVLQGGYRSIHLRS